ncbi:hypothetical protein V2W45_1472554 [Cenococcum geophilum]
MLAKSRVLSRVQPTGWSLPHHIKLGDHSRPLSRSIRVSAERAIYDTKIKGTCNTILLSGPQGNCPPAGPYDQCASYYCKCSKNGGPDNSPKTGTAIWEPLTLTEYKILRVSTTVTLTETATSSGGSEVETVAGSKEDDVRYQKDPKENCLDCGGADLLGLCSSGSKVGCPCEEQQCPADGLPKCLSLECGGDDGNLKCKASGKLKGCQCCPGEESSCFSNDSEKLKGYFYSNLFGSVDALNDEPWPLLPDNAAIKSAAAAAFTTIWGGDLSRATNVLRLYRGA